MLDEVTRDLSEWAPWNDLPPEVLRAVASFLHIEYFPTGVVVDPVAHAADALLLVRTGAVDSVVPGGEFRDRLGPGDTLDLGVALAAGGSVRARQDTLAWLLPRAAFETLAAGPGFARAFAPAFRAARLAPATPPRATACADRSPVGAAAGRPALVLPGGTPVARAALAMRDGDCPCVVVAGDPPGLVTDRDLRNQVVAGGLPLEAPLSALQSPALTVDWATPLGDVVVRMLDRDARHAVVTRDGRPVAVLDGGDLLDRPCLGLLAGAGGVPGDLPARLREAVASWLDGGADAASAGRLVAAVHDARVRRILAEARRDLGAAPARYAWVAVDLAGRRDPVAVPVPDHVLLFEDGASPAAVEAVQALARLAGDRLESLGLPGGGTRATNPLWCRPVSGWRRYVADWTAPGREQAALRAVPFLDARVVAGDAGLAAPLAALREAAARPAFVARLARAARAEPPPVACGPDGFAEADGRVVPSFDAGQRLLGPLEDLARIVALAAGVPEGATGERFAAAGVRSGLDPSLAADLAAAFDWASRRALRVAIERPGGSSAWTPADLGPGDRPCYREVAARVRDAVALLRRLAGTP